ncbi:MAG: hypothetical protein AABW54_01925 [Candidatus Micrarchaeota archaeon]
MPCYPHCKTLSGFVVKDGKERNGVQRYNCRVCRRTWKNAPYAQVVKQYENNRLVRVVHKQVCASTVVDVEFVLAASRLGKTLKTAFVERLNATNRAGPARFHRRTLHYI